MVYWVSSNIRDAFTIGRPLHEVSTPCNGIKTGNVEMFIRRWFEIDFGGIGFGFSSQDEAEKTSYEWFPYSKGGEFRKWYGNNECVLHWEKNGMLIKQYSPKGLYNR